MGPSRTVARRSGWLVGLAFLALSLPAGAEREAGTEEEPRYRFGFEVKGHWRDSEAARFPSPFPFTPEMIPLGQTRVFMETVEEGGMKGFFKTLMTGSDPLLRLEPAAARSNGGIDLRLLCAFMLLLFEITVPLDRST